MFYVSATENKSSFHFSFTCTDLLTMEQVQLPAIDPADMGRLARWRLQECGLGDECGRRLLDEAVRTVDFESMACQGVLNDKDELIDQVAGYGFVPAIYEQGMRAIDHGQREEGLRILTVAGDHHYLPALYHKARMLFFAREVEQSMECLRQLFARDSHYLPAFHMVGLLEMQGKLGGEGKQNKAAGERILRRVARRGYAPACYDLAIHCPSAGPREPMAAASAGCWVCTCITRVGKAKNRN